MKNHTLYDQLQVLEPQEKELDARERIKAMERPLLSWYREHARAFHGGTSRNIPGMDIGNHAPADQSGGCKTLFPAFYGGLTGNQ